MSIALSTKSMLMKLSIISTVLAFLLFSTCSLSAQEIKSPKGYSPQIGATVAMLEDLKRRVTRSVANLSQEETDFLLDDEANRIGAMIMHLAATEKYYQVYTFENRGYNSAERKKWDPAMNLGNQGRKALVGKPISYYLDEWDKIREETLRLLKTGSSMNNHWAWYHVMEHQANHMGQIRMITKRAN